MNVLLFTYSTRWVCVVKAAGMTCLEERKTQTCGFNVEQVCRRDLHASWRPWKHTSGWKAAWLTHIPPAWYLKYVPALNWREAENCSQQPSCLGNDFNTVPLPLLEKTQTGFNPFCTSSRRMQRRNKRKSSDVHEWNPTELFRGNTWMSGRSEKSGVFCPSPEKRVPVRSKQQVPV